MINGIESITLFSKNAKELSDFYKEKVGLKCTMEAEIGNEGEELYGFDFASGANLYISDHSKLKNSDKNPPPERLIFNLETDDIEMEAKKLKDNGVLVVQDIYHMEGYGLIATFEDIDGNNFQLVQIKGNED